MSFVCVHPGAVDDARRIKPAIPHIGEYGIPVRDELGLPKIKDFPTELGSSGETPPD